MTERWARGCARFSRTFSIVTSTNIFCKEAIFLLSWAELYLKSKRNMGFISSSVPDTVIFFTDQDIGFVTMTL